ncbi:MAG: gamma-glutamyltransferase [Rhodospirillales bacterium]|nr:gamma-glutamyltransferase [Rhodospirillales bacterium]
MSLAYGSGRLAAGTRGAVGAGHPASALAGAATLAAGGNALDACVAMAAADWIAMPDMCGPGGDLFALWRDRSGKVYAVNGGGAAPAGYAHPTDPENRAGLCLVPGAPAAIETLLRGGCTLDRETLFAPAIGLAERGTIVGARLDRHLQALRDGSFRRDLAAANGGRLPKVGETLKLPVLGGSLARWAADGAPERELERAVVDWRSDGVAVTASEALAERAERSDALSLPVGGWTIYGQPPMSQAVATLCSIGIAGPDAVRDADTAYRTHMAVESYKAAFARLQEFADGNDPHRAAAAMLEAPTMRASREAIGPRAGQGPAMLRNYGETTQVSAADAEGNVCTLIHSLYRPFGARVLSARTGWIANDRGASFTTGLNAPAPGRRPRHTLVGLLMSHPEYGAYAFGTPGAQAQTQTTLQVAMGLMRDPLHPELAVAAPRWSFIGGDQIAVEASLPTPLLDELSARGHRLALRPPADWLMGSVTLAGFRDGIRIAVADHRREALALAF